MCLDGFTWMVYSGVACLTIWKRVEKCLMCSMDHTRDRPAPIEAQTDGPHTPTASPTVDALRRSLESPSTVFSSPRRAIVYSDRFIPSRATNSRLDFSVLDRERAAHESPVQQEREDANPAYRNMLRQTLLGCVFYFPVPWGQAQSFLCQQCALCRSKIDATNLGLVIGKKSFESDLGNRTVLDIFVMKLQCARTGSAGCTWCTRHRHVFPCKLLACV